MLSRIGRIFRSWRSRRTPGESGVDERFGADRSPPESRGGDASPEGASVRRRRIGGAVPGDQRPSTPEIPGGAAFIQAVRKRVQPSTLRRTVTQITSLAGRHTQVSEARLPTHYVLPRAMRRVQASPMPLVSRQTPSVTEGETLEEETEPTVDAAWDALWRLRGTPREMASS